MNKFIRIRVRSRIVNPLNPLNLFFSAASAYVLEVAVQQALQAQSTPSLEFQANVRHRLIQDTYLVVLEDYLIHSYNGHRYGQITIPSTFDYHSVHLLCSAKMGLIGTSLDVLFPCSYINIYLSVALPKLDKDAFPKYSSDPLFPRSSNMSRRAFDKLLLMGRYLSPPGY